MAVVEAPPRNAVIQLAGDAPDPRGISSARGLLSTHHLSLGKQEVAVVYRDVIMTVDVYQVPGEPTRAILLCPRCHKALTVQASQKAIDFDPHAPNPRQRHLLATGNPEIAAIADRGRLSIEAFECTWEIGEGQHVKGGVHTGVSLCRQRLAIEDNTAKDA